jgi:hypothetical protein
VTSEEIMEFLNVCQFYSNVKLPSEMIGIEDEYTAYCFNEAIAYMTTRIRNGDKPIFMTRERVKNIKTGKLEEVQYKGKHLSSFSDLYKHYDN